MAYMHSPPSKDQVHHLFNEISPTYDLINTLLSLGVDRYWRKKVAAHIPKEPALSLLDLATGTGDQILTILKTHPNIHAIGIDTAEGMLKYARVKTEAALLQSRAMFQEANALELPFQKESFDVLTMSFGIRNVPCVDTCFKEMHRVLKPGGTALILEFSLPNSRWIKTGYLLYLRHLLPRIGACLSKHPTAYTYLNQTIETFPYGNALCDLLKTAGFTTSYSTYTLGVVTLYIAKKPR